MTDMLAALRDPVLALAFSDNTPAITRAVLGAGVYAELGFYALKQTNMLNLAITAGDSVALCYAPVAAALVKYKYIYCAPTAFSVLENKDLKIETIGDLQNWSKLMVTILKFSKPAEASRIFSALERSRGLYTELQQNPRRTLAALKEFEHYRSEAAVNDYKVHQGRFELYPVTDFFYYGFSDSRCMDSFRDYCRKKKNLQSMMDDFIEQASIIQREKKGHWIEVGSSTIPVKD
jgi:hypothetical protein